jgi:hypothetical protein
MSWRLLEGMGRGYVRRQLSARLRSTNRQRNSNGRKSATCSLTFGGAVPLIHFGVLDGSTTALTRGDGMALSRSTGGPSPPTRMRSPGWRQGRARIARCAAAQAPGSSEHDPWRRVAIALVESVDGARHRGADRQVPWDGERGEARPIRGARWLRPRNRRWAGWSRAPWRDPWRRAGGSLAH